MNPVRKGYVDIADGQVHYRMRQGTGAPILFLHQTASSGAMWDAVMTRWPGDHALYAIDTPGFGGSFDPAPDRAPDMETYVEWALAATDALGLERMHVVGHHTGAAIGLGLASRVPARIKSLAMIGPACLTADERAAFARKLGHPFRPVRSGAYLLQNWEYLRVGRADRDVTLLHREMVDMLRAWQARPHAYGAVWAQDFDSLFAALACPTLLMAARDDILFPYLSRARALRPDIPVVELEAGGNFEPDLAPEAVVAALCAHIAEPKL